MLDARTTACMQYLSHHIGVQRLISLNSMRIIIAVFEDVPFLGLNMFLLMTQPDLASNLVFMVSSFFFPNRED